MNDFDKEIFTNHSPTHIIGIDEAGRGCLAGPVVSASFIMPKNFINIYKGATDSKKLTPTKREKIFRQIIANPKNFGVGFSCNREIDKINILNATFLSMKRSHQKFSKISGTLTLVDGNHKIRGVNINQMPVIKGDSKSLAIGLASIVAKVTRDRYMLILDKMYPEYGFAGHKGYPSKSHIEAIKKYGICPAHRTSYAPIKKYLANLEPEGEYEPEFF